MSSIPRTRRLKMLSAVLAAGMIASACFGGNPAGSNAAGSNPAGSNPAGSNPAGSNQLPYWGGKPPDKNVVVPQLPAPASMPPGTPDQAAAVLATQIAAGDAGSLPAILAGLQASGIGIRDGTGGVLIQPAQPSQGYAIDNEQAIALGMTATNPTEMTLAELADTLSVGIPDLKGAPTASLILDGIRARAGDKSPTIRFWADLLIDLGKLPRYGNDPYDLTSAALDPTSTYLDLVQVELILFRFDADLIVWGGQLKAGTASVPAQWPGAIADVNAGTVWVPAQWPGAIADVYTAAGSGNCNMNDSQSQIMDLSAMGITTGFDQALEYMKEAENVSDAGKALGDRVAGITGTANVVLAYLKVVMYYAAIHVDISMDGSGPLIRTKNSTAGERRQLTAHAFFDAKNSQMFNCFRVMLNVLGMDFSGPSDGNLPNSDAQWLLIKGGGTGTTQTNRIVRFVGGDPVHQKTNEGGIATIGIEGYPQKITFPEKTPPAVPNKDAEVWLEVAPKPVSFSQNAIDAAAAVAAGLVGVLTTPAEMLLRSNLLKPAAIHFKVEDWETSFKLTIQVTTTSSPPAQGGTITGTIVTDPTGTFLVGTGTENFQHSYTVSSCKVLKDEPGQGALPVNLGAVDKGDGSFELQSDLGAGASGAGTKAYTLGTFPAAGGAGSGTLSVLGECGWTFYKFEIQADPI